MHYKKEIIKWKVNVLVRFLETKNIIRFLFNPLSRSGIQPLYNHVVS